MNKIYFISLDSLQYSKLCNIGVSSSLNMSDENILHVMESSIYPKDGEIVIINTDLYQVVTTIHNIEDQEIKIYVKKTR